MADPRRYPPDDGPGSSYAPPSFSSQGFGPPRLRAGRTRPRYTGPAFDVDRAVIRDELAAEQADPIEAPLEVSNLYVVLDSFRKNPGNSAPRHGVLSWNFMVQGETGDEMIGLPDTPDKVSQLEIGSFTMPVLPEVPYVITNGPTAAPGQLYLQQNNSSPTGFPPLLVVVGTAIGLTGAPYGFGQYPSVAIPEPNSYAPGTSAAIVPWINNPYTQLAHGNRMTIQVQEAGKQGYLDRKGGRHHFEVIVAHSGGAGANPNFLQAIPAAGGNVFSFPVVLKDLHGITLTFRGPDLPIAFDHDVFYSAAVLLDGQPAPGPYLYLDIDVTGLNAGDRIFVEGLRSGNSVLDNYANRLAGHAINHAPSIFLPPSNPGIPLPSLGGGVYTDPAIGVAALDPLPVMPPGGWRANVFIAKRRMRIPLRIERRTLSRYAVPHLWNRE